MEICLKSAKLFFKIGLQGINSYFIMDEAGLGEKI